KMKQSGLVYAAALRFQLDLKPQWTERHVSAQDDLPANGATSADLMEMIVRGLKQQYGDKLYVLYMPPQPFSAEEPLEPAEALLMEQCRAQGVKCRSVRDRMIRELLVHHRMSRGFADTQPGIGHLNARGHEVVADEIFDWLKAD